ncbi:hypothetical protein QQF64_009577 [Cirrhinus molitorella]|uniref:Uncharacterized protein n=1 Tax=Cirrhinus molitorella TaxID=172907 RepID=A0ABR3M324_9TELE
MFILAPQGQPVTLPEAPPIPQTTVPYSTEYYRKKKQEREQIGLKSRKYVRKNKVILRKKCNKERKPPSHLQYFGNWYCEEAATESFTEWRAALEMRGYGKKRPLSGEKIHMQPFI